MDNQHKYNHIIQKYNNVLNKDFFEDLLNGMLQSGDYVLLTTWYIFKDWNCLFGDFMKTFSKADIFGRI